MSADITTASLSDVGRVRTRNEDFCNEFVNSSGYRLLVVADGMGGHRAGAIASRVAVETIGEVFADSTDDPESMLRRALEAANDRVFQMAVADPELRGMGTTTVTLLLGPGLTGWVAHVGDSRAYRCRDEALEGLTRDHSVVAEMQRRGLLTPEEAAVHPRRNEILRSVGVGPEVEVDIMPIQVEPGDRYVLCSDGLSGLLGDDEIAAIVQTEEPSQAARSLVNAANERGGHDNVTVQIANIPIADPPVQPQTLTPGSMANQGRRLARRRRRAMVIAVLIAGLAALTLLWRVHAVNSARQSARTGMERPAPSGQAPPSGVRRAGAERTDAGSPVPWRR